MSSKRAGGKALWELFELAGKLALGGGEIIFKTYKKMRLGGMPRSTYIQKLQKFEKYGLIEKSKSAHGNVFIITTKAKLLRRQAIKKSDRNDGFATLILFDIPEEKRNARDTLRRYLIRSGYTQIRESCFLSPFGMFSELKELIQELKLEKDISIFAAKPEYHFK